MNETPGTISARTAQGLALSEKLNRQVLEPIKRAFVGKDEIIDLLGVSLVAGENLFILGPPGTAKSARWCTNWPDGWKDACSPTC